MTPDQIAKSGSESGHQTALVAYCRIVKMFGWDAADQWSQTGVNPCGHWNGVLAVPQLQWLHSIPNGGLRGDTKESAMRRGAKLVAEGALAGIPDLFLPVPKQAGAQTGVYAYCGLYIEMKKPDLKPKTERSKGGLSEEQVSFKNYALESGYGWAVCYTWREAANLLRSYLEF